MKRLLMVFLLLGLTLPVYAKTLEPVVNLLSIKANKTSEKQGDELYMHVTVFPSKGKSEVYTIPQHPMHWPSEALEKINNLKLWDGSLREGQSVSVIFSLLEQDFPPWNTDDLIGSVKLRLKNNKGQLESNWSMPNRIDSPETIMTKFGEAQKFILLGEGSQYELYFILKK